MKWKQIIPILWEAWERIDIPDAPWVIFDKPNNDELFDLLEKVNFPDDNFNSGVLFVAKVFEGSVPGTGAVKSISIEGIGSNTEKARMNYLAGILDPQNNESFSKLQEELDKQSDSDGFGYERIKSKDIGIFVKVRADGKKIVEDDIDMELLRFESQRKFVSLIELSNNRTTNMLAGLYNNQIYYDKILDTYSDALRDKKMLSRLNKSQSLRRDALRQLQRASEQHREAAKWSRVAKGFAVMASVMSLASNAASSYEAKKAKGATDEKLMSIQKALSTNANLASEQENIAQNRMGVIENSLRAIGQDIGTLNSEIKNLTENTLPNVPAPVIDVNTNAIIIDNRNWEIRTKVDVNKPR